MDICPMRMRGGYETVRFEIDQGDTPYKAKDFPIEVAKRDEMSQIIHL